MNCKKGDLCMVKSDPTIQPKARNLIGRGSMKARSTWPFKVAGQITHARPVVVASEDEPQNDALYEPMPAPIESFADFDARINRDVVGKIMRGEGK